MRVADFGAAAEALGVTEGFRERFVFWVQTHAMGREGCPTEGVTVTPAGLLVGDCRCECEDHLCGPDARAEAAAGFCPTCRDTGYTRLAVPLGHPAFSKAQRCPRCNGAGSEARIAFLQREAGVPALWWDTHALSRLPVVSAARQAAEAWLNGGRDRQPFLVLCGTPGTGKTHAAVGTAGRVLDEDRTVYVVKAVDLLDRLRASFDADSGLTASAVLRRPREAELFVLDDLGSERRTEWSDERLFAVIDHRYERGMWTVITTNLAPGMAPRDRMWSRVSGDRRARVVDTSGPDRRRLMEGEQR